jgi:sugar/nucleoside kinase (ribokinase family)
MLEPIDYLCVGHVTRDLTPAGPLVGGAVTYSALTARALGRRPGIITSAEPDYDLKEALGDIPILLIPSESTTTFENTYTSSGRRQIVHSVAGTLTPEAVPPEWREPSIVHLAPVAHELDPDLIDLFQDRFVGVTPQGWHRTWGSTGRVTFAPWPAAAEVLPLAAAVIVSREDICDEDTWALYRRLCRLFVITDGAGGCVVHHRDQQRHFPSLQVPETDPTGVGDIFAASFFVRLRETDGDAWEAARFATRIAAPTVTRSGLDGIPTPAEIATARSGQDRHPS